MITLHVTTSYRVGISRSHVINAGYNPNSTKRLIISGLNFRTVILFEFTDVSVELLSSISKVCE